MITLLRSLTELMIMTKSRDQISKDSMNEDLLVSSDVVEKSGIERIYKNKKLIGLPNVPKIERRKWRKSKEAVSKFLDELDYNNQIQSSYDLTLLERQTNYKHNDAA